MLNQLISVVVPVYNVEKYIDKCLESIVNQTYKELEIILVDDGSTDNCPQICDEWATKDSRIRVIHKINAGLGMARNSGIELAVGEYIMFVDSDDYLAVNAIQVLHERLIVDDSDMAIGQLVKVYEDGSTRSSTCDWLYDTVFSREQIFELLGSNKTFPCYAGAKLYKKTIFDEILYPALKCAEDVFILPHIIEKCNSVSIISEIIYYYFQRDTSIVHTKDDAKILDSILAALYVAKYFMDHEMMNNASSYYNSAIFQSFDVKEKRKARKLINETFSHTQRKKLLDKSLGIRIRFWALYIPLLTNLVKCIKYNKCVVA